MIEDTLKNFKEKISDYEYKTEFIYFEFTDLEKIYSLNNCSEIENINDNYFLKFKKNKLIPDTNIKLNHTAETNKVCPISGWTANNNKIGKTINVLRKNLI